MRKTKNLIITIVLIVLVGITGYLVFTNTSSNGNRDDGDKPAIIDNNTAASSSVTEEGGAGLASTGIKIEDQNPGRIVVVNQVLIETAGWVVIHEDSNGTPGNILGARIFEKGSNSGVIQLLSSMKVGKSYLAVVHTDNGDGSFDVKQDKILKDANGKDVMTKFSVTQGSDAPTQ
jgi:hypothetical protein